MTTVHTSSRQPSSAPILLSQLERICEDIYACIIHHNVRRREVLGRPFEHVPYLEPNSCDPIPLPAPVTIAILFLSRSDIV